MAQTEFCVAPSGSGKSFRRCAHFLATEFLPHSSAKIFTNFPINIEKMVEFVIARHPDLAETVLRDRIHIIPKAELDKWMREESGPWEYFHTIDVDGGRIAIDEIHNFVSLSSSKEYVQKWRLFLGELRHRGCEFECLSQTETKVAKAIRDEAGLRRSLFNSEDRVDPFFRVRQEDWLNLKAGFTGEYIPTVFEFDKVIIDGKWKETKVGKFKLDPLFYPLYDSYSTPIAGGTKSRGKVRPFQSLSLPALFWWFFRRNCFLLLPRLLALILILWVTIGGGTPILIEKFMTLMKSSYKENHPDDTHKVDPKPIQFPPDTVPPPPAVVSPSATSADLIERSLAEKYVSDSVLPYKKRVLELEAINADLRLKLDNVTSERDKNAKVLDSNSQLLGISQGSAIFSTGETVLAGSVIRTGKYANLSLVRVDPRNRFALLSDGTVLYLAR